MDLLWDPSRALGMKSSRVAVPGRLASLEVATKGRRGLKK